MHGDVSVGVWDWHLWAFSGQFLGSNESKNSVLLGCTSENLLEFYSVFGFQKSHLIVTPAGCAVLSIKVLLDGHVPGIWSMHISSLQWRREHVHNLILSWFPTSRCITINNLFLYLRIGCSSLYGQKHFLEAFERFASTVVSDLSFLGLCTYSSTLP